MEKIYLEEWVHDAIRAEARAEPELRSCLGTLQPGRMTREDVDRYHLFKLKKMLAYVHEKSSFYRELFAKDGVRPSDVSSLADLQRIPFTDSSELAHNPSRFVCVSMKDVERVTTFTTSGTTGPEKRIFCTRNDMERITDFMGAGIRTVAAREDVVQIMLPSGSVNNQADLLEQGVRKMGATPVKTGLNKSSEEQLALLKEHGTTVLFGVTSGIYRMTQELKDRHALDKLGLKTVFVTSGYLADAQREHLRRIWNCDVHTHYGLTEMGLGVAVECHAHDGYHFNEADLLLEVVDPKTGRVLTEGEGELVFTTLRREGTPLLRYRTHDIAQLIKEPCPCGATTLLRFGKVTKRIELIVRLSNGHEIYPSLFDEVLYKLPELVDYDVTVKNNIGKERLHFLAEVTAPGENIENEMSRLLRDGVHTRGFLESGFMEEPEITTVPLGGISRMGRAKKKIEDQRVF